MKRVRTWRCRSCTGGGSNFAGIAFPYIGDKLRGEGYGNLRIVAVEPAACPTMTRGKYAYDFGDTAHLTPLVKMHTLGSGFVPPGFHAGGLRYHGMAPMISHLLELGLIEATLILIVTIIAVRNLPGVLELAVLRATSIDPGTRSLRLRATLENPQARLRPGMFAEVRVELPQRSAVLTLPQTAISYNPYGDSVFVIQQGEAGSNVQRRQVETGTVRDSRVEIVQGLQIGEQVVIAGQVKLRNGQAVVVDNSIPLEPQVTGP